MRRPRLLLGAGVVLVILALGGILAGVVGGGFENRPGSRVSPARPGTPTTPTNRPAPSSLPSSTAHRPALKPVPQASVVPTGSPVQRRDDQALAKGLASSPGVSAAEGARAPAPGFSRSWPALAPANEPDPWTRAFVSRLLAIDFAHQSRAGLGAWLSAEEAPESLPGIPARARDKMLYLSLFDPGGLGGASTPIPSAVRWAALARTGARWTASQLLVQPHAAWSALVASGWEPTDPRMSAEDVSGLLTVTRGRSRTTHRFSMVVYVGSAHWHPGYGTVLVTDWKEH